MFSTQKVLFSVNKAKSQSPTVLEYALLSLQVYYADDDPTKPPLSDGWVSEYNSIMDDTTGSGYYGECFVKYEGSNPLAIVFAHRGTVLFNVKDPIGDFKNLVGDIDTAFKNIPVQTSKMVDFLYRVEINFQERFGQDYTNRVPISFTGHSLGAVLADISCAVLDPTATFKSMTSTTFENPGSYPIIKNFIEQETTTKRGEAAILTRLANKCTVYLADVNLVNSCNQQLGSVNRLALPYLFDSYLFVFGYIPNPTYLNIDYAIYTYQQHSMANIYNYFVQNNVITSDDNPVGFQNGYIRYLDQDKRLRYWINYFEAVWSGSAAIRLLYNENNEMFIEISLAELKVVQKQASMSTETKQETFALSNILKHNIFKNNRVCQVLANEDDISRDFVFINN